MSILISFSVGDGDMFSIKHNSNNFTMIDTHMNDANRNLITEVLKEQQSDKDIVRFISTHPDQDHLAGLEHIDNEVGIPNFYCIKNKATKTPPESSDFKYYKKLRDGDKAFYLFRGCRRKWMNDDDGTHGPSGLSCLWPDTANQDFRDALAVCENSGNANNTSIILKYSVENSAKYLFMGDLETDMMEKIENVVNWPKIDILFAPHHGRSSATVPSSILAILDPQIIVLGEAPSQHIQYYPGYNTITQNSAKSIVFESVEGWVHIYCTNSNYSVNFLINLGRGPYNGCHYLGSLSV